MNRPLPLVAKDAKAAKKNILESREKAAFQKVASSLSGEGIIAVRREVFWLPHLSSGSKISFLGVLRALSKVGGSFLKKYTPSG